jgi:phosphatidylglycerol:prolipoprotein diacylglycerol transferase
VVLNAIVYPHFDPVIFKLWIITVRWYALAYIAGILLGWWYVLRLARKEALWAPRIVNLNRDQIDDLVLYVTLGVIVGGRLGSVIFYNTSMIWTDPLEIIRIDHGGMSFHGGLIGVGIALLIFARMKKVSFLTIGDLVAPCVPIGLFFGRLANFVNNELWGRATTVPWGFTDTSRGEDVVVHPSQLYEATLEGVVLFIILRLATHRFGQLKKPGAVTGLFLMFYGLFRMAIETVRQPDVGLDHWPLGLTMGMVLSFLMFLPGLWLFLRSRKAPVEVDAPVEAEVPIPVLARRSDAKPAAKSTGDDIPIPATPETVAPKPSPKPAVAKPAVKAAAKTAAPKAAPAKPKPAAKAPAKPAVKPAAEPKAKPATAKSPPAKKPTK